MPPHQAPPGAVGELTENGAVVEFPVLGMGRASVGIQVQLQSGQGTGSVERTLRRGGHLYDSLLSVWYGHGTGAGTHGSPQREAVGAYQLPQIIQHRNGTELGARFSGRCSGRILFGLAAHENRKTQLVNDTDEFSGSRIGRLSHHTVSQQHLV